MPGPLNQSAERTDLINMKRLPKNAREPSRWSTFKKTISLSFVLSVLLHLGLGGAILSQNTDILKNLTAPKPKVSEVELVDAQKFMEQFAAKKKEIAHTPQGQIVQQEQQMNDEITKTRFLSKHNQRVVEQTQAQLNGKFKNTDETGGEKKALKTPGKTKEVAESQEESRPEQKAVKGEKELLTSDDGPAVHSANEKMKEFMPSFRPSAPRVMARDQASGGGEGASATDDHLKDVKTGLQTMLSTREFLYYSYYNRIRSKLTQYWQPMIKDKMERIMKQGRTIASTGDKITRIVIVLDETGTLRKVQVLGASGVSDLDEAAVEAFRAAAPFPNPPKGMVESDGTIKIRWDFVLEA